MTKAIEPNRRTALFLLGLLWFLTALGILLSTTEPNRLIPHERLPVSVRVTVWALPGLVAWVSVWWRRLDAVGWIALCIPPLERFASFAWAWIDSLTDWWLWDHSPGIGTAWRSALVYLTIIVLIVICAAGLDRLPFRRGQNGE